MKILIISGFLGAGKTTFIQAMAKATGRQFCIVENEFGEIGIDGPLLAKGNVNADKQGDEKSQVEQEGFNSPTQGTIDDLNIFELTEGCICCNPNIDFGSSVLTIANTINPDYLIVEPSGVAYLSRILEQIKPFCYEHIGLLAPITLVDSLHFNESMQEFFPYFKNQVEYAGTIVLTKSENMSENEFYEIKQHLLDKGLEFDPLASFPSTHYSKWARDDWFAFLHKELEWLVESEISANDVSEDKGDKKELKSLLNSSKKFRFVKKEIKKEESMQSVGIKEISLESIDELITVLTIIVSGLCGRVVRGKGYLTLKDETIRFDIVEGIYSITTYDTMPDERGIIIGKGLNREAINNLFRMKDFRKK